MTQEWLERDAVCLYWVRRFRRASFGLMPDDEKSLEEKEEEQTAAPKEYLPIGNNTYPDPYPDPILILMSVR